MRHVCADGKLYSSYSPLYCPRPQYIGKKPLYSYYTICHRLNISYRITHYVRIEIAYVSDLRSNRYYFLLSLTQSIFCINCSPRLPGPGLKFVSLDDC